METRRTNKITDLRSEGTVLDGVLRKRRPRIVVVQAIDQRGRSNARWRRTFPISSAASEHGVLIAGAVDRMGAVGEEIDEMTCGIWRRFCMRLSTANKAKAPAWKTCPSLLLVFLDCIKSSNVFSYPIWASYNFHLTSLSQDVIARAACSVALSFVPQGEVGMGHHHAW